MTLLMVQSVKILIRNECCLKFTVTIAQKNHIFIEKPSILYKIGLPNAEK